MLILQTTVPMSHFMETGYRQFIQYKTNIFDQFVAQNSEVGTPIVFCRPIVSPWHRLSIALLEFNVSSFFTEGDRFLSQGLLGSWGKFW